MRQWWQPPQLRLDDDSEAERRATWLELFYDLVFVVAIAQLAHKLNEDVSLFGFVALFIKICGFNTPPLVGGTDKCDIVHSPHSRRMVRFVPSKFIFQRNERMIGKVKWEKGGREIN